MERRGKEGEGQEREDRWKRGQRAATRPKEQWGGSHQLGECTLASMTWEGDHRVCLSPLSNACSEVRSPRSELGQPQAPENFPLPIPPSPPSPLFMNHLKCAGPLDPRPHPPPMSTPLIGQYPVHMPKAAVCSGCAFPASLPLCRSVRSSQTLGTESARPSPSTHCGHRQAIHALKPPDLRVFLCLTSVDFPYCEGQWSNHFRRPKRKGR